MRPSLSARLIAAWVALMTRYAIIVVVGGVLITLVAGWYTATHLAIDTDNASLISDQVDWRQTYLAYQQAFPAYTDNLAIVIDGITPDVADRAARRMTRALHAEPRLFQAIYAPGSDAFFTRNALLYLDTPALSQLAERLTRIQPFVGRLATEPTLPVFFSLLGRAMAPDAPVDFDLAPVFTELNNTFGASREQRFYPLSWQSLVGLPDLSGAATQRVVLTRPKLDYDSFVAASKPLARIRQLAQKLDLDAEHGVSVRLTGEAALTEQAMTNVSRGALWGATAALLAVGIILYFGLRSVRLMAAALASLVAGLVGTATFAFWAVGTLNLISVAFAVLYIGLGIDYAIHLCMAYREARTIDADPSAAIQRAAGNAGASLWLCAVTTAAGFFAFIPTAYSGVAELGLISGTGMFISLVVSLTFLPALISLIPARRIRPLGQCRAVSSPKRFEPGPRLRWSVCAAALMVALACATALPYLHFNSDTLDLNNPGGEAVTTYRQLLADSDHSPLTLVVTRPDAATAKRVAGRLAQRPQVARTMTIDDFIPDNQQPKLDIVADLALTLALQPPDMSRHADFSARQHAIAVFVRRLNRWREANGDGPASAAARRLAKTIARWRDWLAGLPGDRQREVMATLDARVFDGFEQQITRLRQALRARHVTQADLPEAIRRRWIGRDGSYRVEIFAAGDINDQDTLRSFVAAARQAAPMVTGAPLLQVAAARTVSQAFVQAFAYAGVFITLLLLLLLRSVVDTLRVLAPIALAGLIVAAVAVWLGIAFNFANIVALPLLLGIGVDNGIHVVNRLRRRDERAAFFATSTARAVMLSALTTLAGFGSLAFSHHPGTASMGQLLAIGMVATLLSTLIVVPALFAVSDRLAGE